MKKTIPSAIIMIILLTCVGTVSAANLVSNGDFESNIISNPFITIPPGILPGWTLEGGEVDQIRGYWTPFEGFQSLDLAGSFPGTISQTISTVNGQAYKFSFAMAGNPACPSAGITNSPVVKKLDVYWDDVPVAAYTFDTTSTDTTNMGWVTHMLPVTATKANTIIRFEDESFTTGDDTHCGVALDNIVVEEEGNNVPVPEFPTIALPAALIVGLIGAVLFIRKSKDY